MENRQRENKYPKKAIIIAAIIGIYLLALNPYVIKTAKDQAAVSWSLRETSSERIKEN